MFSVYFFDGLPRRWREKQDRFWSTFARDKRFDSTYTWFRAESMLVGGSYIQGPVDPKTGFLLTPEDFERREDVAQCPSCNHLYDLPYYPDPPISEYVEVPIRRTASNPYGFPPEALRVHKMWDTPTAFDKLRRRPRPIRCGQCGTKF